ncbi:DUF4082 domain-containing protein [Nocardioides sp.]|uniref:DUF4082 domain-containing protein n=1 Tax=Nocardioides sp. TaxID=35761 RepID=UPI0039E25717
MPVPHAHTRAGQLVVLALGIVMTLAGLVGVAAKATAADDPCAPGGNPIVCENSLPGTDPEEWDIYNESAGDSEIQGFATDISVNAGSPVSFKIDTEATAYTITIYRIGYYGGDGAREIASVTPSATLPQDQPNCLWDASTELTDCGNWAVSATWDVPSSAVSGVYIAKLEIPSTGARSHITFVVRDDSSDSDVVFQTSDPTWVAYNTYGGSSFYVGGEHGRAYKLSYNRPFATRSGGTNHDFFFANEYPMVRFLESNGYDVSYLAGVDSDRYGSLLLNHKVFLSVGHDEYWSGAQRANVEAARDAGVNLQFLSGNEVYWRTRYEPSISEDQTDYRTLVSYKESWGWGKIDTTSAEWTGTWRDPRYAAPSVGAGLPENALTGTIFMSNLTDLPVTVTKEQGKTRLWRDTGLASMTDDSTALAPHTVGYESDEDQDNGARPPGLIALSRTTGPISGQYMQDYANTTGDGTTTHSITLYRAPSGALVFGAGSVQWTWGLDGEHDSDDDLEPADVRMQQAEVNLLADMGAQPATLASGLVAATKSTDTTGPSVAITSPAAGASLANGAQVSVTGTAADTGGGVVAGVEYSTDGGTSWHPAEGTTAWTIDEVQTGLGATPLQVRAVDDSANIGATATRSFDVSCPCSVFGDAAIPTTWTSATGPSLPAADDDSAAELGLRFSPLADGFVTGVRFYQGAENTGSHVGSLWSSSGERLASVTFADETGSGWQQATFASPVAVAAGTTYVVSYTAPNGHYAVQTYGFGASGRSAPPLEVDGGYGATPAGVYGVAGTFPNLSWRSSNYYVDVLFTTTDDSPLVASDQWPVAGSASVARDTTISARFSKPLQSGSEGITVTDELGDPVSGTTSYAASTRTITFTPAASLSGFVDYTVQLTGTDTQGNQVQDGSTWTFRTAKPPATAGVCPCSLFDEDTVPAIAEDVEHAALNLGVRFSTDTDGTVTGIRFYKALGNTPSHTGTLWSADGAVLAQGTFTDESTTGWQTLVLDQPVAIESGVTYVASYHTNGAYSATPNAFASADLSKGPLQVTSTAGAYAYGDGFPSASSPSSYLVDVVFEPGETTDSDPTDPPSDPPISDTAQTLFGGLTPVQPATDDSSPVEVGTAFTPAVDGTVTALRFYKGTGNGGSHVGSLWNSAGDLLASVTFTDETSSGWQQATLASPVSLDAGTTYVVSYLAPQGHYASTPGLLSTPLTSGDLTAPSANNGRYLYGGGFPTYSYQSTGYFADVVFEPDALPAVPTGETLFGQTTPATAAVNESDAVELGTAFSPTVAGDAVAVRFYKGAGNTGSHVGSLWSSAGDLLASVTFADETSSGWQSAELPTPVPLTPGETYVVSYYAPNGHYSATSGFFDSAYTAGTLTAPAGSNGRFRYGTGGGFPTGSFRSTGYFADLVFQPSS